jgi:uncharacterized protein (DUF2141 family)
MRLPGKTLSPLALLFGVALALVTRADAPTGSIFVELVGLKSVEGTVYIAVYDSDDNWLSDDTVLEKSLVIAESREGDTVRTELQLPLGEYALSVFYDINGNGELDTNFIGLPKEPIALSNNAKAKFGPPKYKDAVFTLGFEPVIQRIDIKQL